MTTHKSRLRLILSFIRKSYPPTLRKALIGILVISVVATITITEHQKTTIDQRITNRGVEIREWAKQVNEGVEEHYFGCLSAHGKNTAERFTQRDFERCGSWLDGQVNPNVYPDKELSRLKQLKNNLENDSFIFLTIYLFILLVIIIPIARLAFIATKWSLKKIWWAGKRIYIESRQMSTFQKYSLVLSALILIAFIALVVVVIFLFG